VSDLGNLLLASVYKHVLVETGNCLRGPYIPVPQVLGGSPIYNFLLFIMKCILTALLLSRPARIHFIIKLLSFLSQSLELVHTH